MVSVKILKEYEYDIIEQYYSYIIESKINGQHQQVKDLIDELSSKQKKEFIHFVDCNYKTHEDAVYCKKVCLKLFYKLK